MKTDVQIFELIPETGMVQLNLIPVISFTYKQMFLTILDVEHYHL